MSENPIVPVTQAPPPPAVVAPASAPPPADPADLWNGDGGRQFYTNLNLSDPEQRRLVYRAMAAPSCKTEEWFNRPFPLFAVVVHSYESESETGEVVALVRSVLLGPAGETLAVVSAGVLSSLRLLINLEGAGPWQPALSVVLRQESTKKGRRIYRLEPDAAPRPVENSAPNKKGK